MKYSCNESVIIDDNIRLEGEVICIFDKVIPRYRVYLGGQSFILCEERLSTWQLTEIGQIL